jgi:hypothetical protein
MIAGSYPGLGKEGAIFLLTFGHGGIHKKVAVLWQDEPHTHSIFHSLTSSSTTNNFFLF